MHHTNRLYHRAAWAVLLGLSLGGTASAQQAAPPPAPAGGQPVAAMSGKILVLPIGGSQRVRMSKGQPIADVQNPRPTIVRVLPVEGDPTSVLVTGIDAGTVRIVLADANKNSEMLDVAVQFDVEFLRTLIVRAVPTANVTPIPGAGNTVVLTGTASHPDDADAIIRAAASVAGGPERVINMMRVGGVQQVQLDVVVAQVSRTKFRAMAFNFLTDSRNTLFGSTVGQAVVNPAPIGALSGQLSTGGQITAFAGRPNGIDTNLFGGVFKDSFGLLMFLQALKNEQVVKLMSQPRLLALSGRPASLLSGGEQAVPVPAGLGQIGVQFEEFGTRLNFIPTVLGNGRIHLEVEPEVSNLNAANGTDVSGFRVPGRDTQRVHTTVELEDGQTFVLAGLIQRNVTGNTSKVPVLGELPYIGAAFSTKSYNEFETELVVVVTPHLVDAMSCDQAPKIFPGQETRSPDDFELFLEGILEAPRGPREVCPDRHYVPAFKNSPTAGLFPCAGNGSNYGCNAAGCGTGNGAVASVVTSQPLPAQDAKVVAKESATLPASLGAATPLPEPGTPANSPAAEGGKPAPTTAAPAAEGAKPAPTTAAAPETKTESKPDSLPPVGPEANGSKDQQ